MVARNKGTQMPIRQLGDFDIHWHESNPWAKTCLYVPLAVLAECHKGLGQKIIIKGQVEILTEEKILQSWIDTGPVDAYIVSQGDHDHYTAGVRYGGAESDYLSGYFDTSKLKDLVDLYQETVALNQVVEVGKTTKTASKL